MRIRDCDFTYDSDASTLYTSGTDPDNHILMNNVQDYIIYENTFNHNYATNTSQIKIKNTTALTLGQIPTTLRKIYQNTFNNGASGSAVGTKAIDAAEHCKNLTITCNGFGEFEHDIYLRSGLLDFSDQKNMWGTNTYEAKNSPIGNSTQVKIYNASSFSNWGYYHTATPSLTGPGTLIANAAAYNCPALTCQGHPTSVRPVFNAGAVSVYPNPSTGVTTISLGGVNVTDINVYSSDGRLCYKSKTQNQETIFIDLGNFANGMYYVNLYEGENLVGTKKLSVIKF